MKLFIFCILFFYSVGYGYEIIRFNIKESITERKHVCYHDDYSHVLFINNNTIQSYRNFEWFRGITIGIMPIPHYSVRWQNFLSCYKDQTLYTIIDQNRKQRVFLNGKNEIQFKIGDITYAKMLNETTFAINENIYNHAFELVYTLDKNFKDIVVNGTNWMVLYDNGAVMDQTNKTLIVHNADKMYINNTNLFMVSNESVQVYKIINNKWLLDSYFNLTKSEYHSQTYLTFDDENILVEETFNVPTERYDGWMGYVVTYWTKYFKYSIYSRHGKVLNWSNEFKSQYYRLAERGVMYNTPNVILNNYGFYVDTFNGRACVNRIPFYLHATQYFNLYLNNRFIERGSYYTKLDDTLTHFHVSPPCNDVNAYLYDSKSNITYQAKVVYETCQINWNDLFNDLEIIKNNNRTLWFSLTDIENALVIEDNVNPIITKYQRKQPSFRVADMRTNKTDEFLVIQFDLNSQLLEFMDCTPPETLSLLFNTSSSSHPLTKHHMTYTAYIKTIEIDKYAWRSYVVDNTYIHDLEYTILYEGNIPSTCNQTKTYIDEQQHYSIQFKQKIVQPVSHCTKKLCKKSKSCKWKKKCIFF